MTHQCNLSNVNFSSPSDSWEETFENCSFNFIFNGSFPYGPDKKTEIAFRIIFYLGAAFLNIVLVYVIYKDPLKRFRNQPTYFILNLTLADLLAIFTGFSHCALQLSFRRNTRQERIVHCLNAIGIQASFIIIMILAADRFIALTLPYQYRNITEKKFVLVVSILFPWCFAIVIMPLSYFYESSTEMLNKVFAGNVIFLTVISVTLYPLTYVSFKKKLKEFSTTNSINDQLLEENLKITKALGKTIIIVSSCLVIFTMPFLLAFCFITAKCTQCLLSDAFLYLWQYHPLMTSFRLFANSIVYAWRMPLYRQSVKTFLLTSRCFTWRHSSRARVSTSENVGMSSSQTVSHNLSESQPKKKESGNGVVLGVVIKNKFADNDDSKENPSKT